MPTFLVELGGVWYVILVPCLSGKDTLTKDTQCFVWACLVNEAKPW